jgi:hypothetical protein
VLRRRTNTRSAGSSATAACCICSTIIRPVHSLPLSRPARRVTFALPMSFKALVYAYVIGGLTFIPLLIISLLAYTFYTSVPVADSDATKPAGKRQSNKTAASQRRKSPLHQTQHSI